MSNGYDFKLEDAYRFCRLMKYDVIRDEIENLIIDYKLEDIEYKENKFSCTFCRKEEKMILTMSENTINVLEYQKNKVKKIRIDDNFILSDQSIDKRENGVVYNDLLKKFSFSKKYGNKLVLSDLDEKRYVFKKKSIQELLNNTRYEDARAMYILLKLSILDEQVNLEDYSSLTTYFETHMNNYLGLDNGRKLVGNHCSNKTYFNGEDISRSYDLVDGKDKINRIYDLYNGIINERNIYDIDSIRLGFLNSDCFDIRKLKNINVLENELIGKEKEYDDNYLTNVKKLLNYKYGYDGDLKLERESLLDAISYRMSANLLAKKQVEKIIGVPYDEFDLLDFDEQQKLIEEMTNKKLLGTVCKEKCLERVNNLEDKKTTKILRKIFKKNNKK